MSPAAAMSALPQRSFSAIPLRSNDFKRKFGLGANGGPMRHETRLKISKPTETGSPPHAPDINSYPALHVQKSPRRPKRR